MSKSHCPVVWDFDQEFSVCQKCLKEHYRNYCFYYWIKLFLWQEGLSKEVMIHFRKRRDVLDDSSYKLWLSNRQLRIYVSDDSVYVQVISGIQIDSRCRPLISN